MSSCHHLAAGDAVSGSGSGPPRATSECCTQSLPVYDTVQAPGRYEFEMVSHGPATHVVHDLYESLEQRVPMEVSPDGFAPFLLIWRRGAGHIGGAGRAFHELGRTVFGPRLVTRHPALHPTCHDQARRRRRHL